MGRAEPAPYPHISLLRHGSFQRAKICSDGGEHHYKFLFNRHKTAPKAF